MAFETNEDGSLKFIDKNFYKKEVVKKIETVNKVFTISSLYSCNIQTSVPGESLKIETKDIISFLELDKIVSFNITNDSIILSTSDEQNYYLYFVSEGEAIKGYDKIEDALNGITVVCTDTPVTIQFTLSQYNIDTSYSTLLYPAIIFIDNLEPIQVSSKSDLIIKLNNLYSIYGNVTDNANNWSVDFTFFPFKKEFFPKQIRILPRHLNFEVVGKEMLFIMDISKEKFFLFEEETYVKPIEDVFKFTNPNNKKVRIYFSEHNCYSLELGLAKTINIISVPTVTEFPTNSPNIKFFKTIGTSIANLSDLLSNSISLESINIKDCGYLLPSFVIFLNLKRIFIENSINTTLLINNNLVETLYLKNVKIISITGSYQSLISLKVVDCGGLQTLNISNTKLKEFHCVNNPLTVLNINSINNKLYVFEVINTKVSSITLTNTEIKNINFINVSGNNNFLLPALNTFLTQIKNYNTSQGGYLNIKNSIYDFTVSEENLIDEIKKRGWVVVQF